MKDHEIYVAMMNGIAGVKKEIFSEVLHVRVVKYIRNWAIRTGKQQQFLIRYRKRFIDDEKCIRRARA